MRWQRFPRQSFGKRFGAMTGGGSKSGQSKTKNLFISPCAKWIMQNEIDTMAPHPNITLAFDSGDQKDENYYFLRFLQKKKRFFFCFLLRHVRSDHNSLNYIICFEWKISRSWLLFSSSSSSLQILLFASIFRFVSNAKICAADSKHIRALCLLQTQHSFGTDAATK